MVMRSIYLIMGCCLMFAAVMVMGLAMQSCRTKKLVDQQTQVQAETMTAYKEELDSMAFCRLLERNRRLFSLEVRHFRPVKDSTGKVTDTYMDKQVWLTHHHIHDRDSGGLRKYRRSWADSTRAAAKVEAEVDEEPAPKDYTVFFILALLILVVVFIRR